MPAYSGCAHPFPKETMPTWAPEASKRGPPLSPWHAAKNRREEDEQNAFSEQGDDIVKWDVSIAYSWNKPRLRQELKLEIQNATNNQGIVDEYFNSATNEIEYSTQLPMFPVLMYTLQF